MLAVAYIYKILYKDIVRFLIAKIYKYDIKILNK